MGEFTGIEPLLQWMEETGLLDFLADLIASIAGEAVYAFFIALFSSLGGLVISGITLIVTAIVTVITAIALLVGYVLSSIGLSRMAKKLGVSQRFLAWVPYGRAYLLGVCAEQSMLRQEKQTWKWGYILLFTSLGLGIGRPVVQLVLDIILSFIPGLSLLIRLVLSLSTVILSAMFGHCLWSILKEYMERVPAIILALLGALGGKGVFAVLVFIVGFLKLRPAKTMEVAVVEAEIGDEVGSQVSSENGCEITNT